MAESALTAKSKAFSLEVIRLCRGCARQNVRAHLSISFCAPVRASGQMFAKHFTHRGWCAMGCYGQIVRIFFAEMIFWVPTRFIQNDIKASASYLDKLAEKKQMKYMQKAASAD